MGVRLEVGQTQEYFFSLLKRWSTDEKPMPENLKHSENHLLQVMAELHLHTDELKKLLHKSTSTTSA